MQDYFFSHFSMKTDLNDLKKVTKKLFCYSVKKNPLQYDLNANKQQQQTIS